MKSATVKLVDAQNMNLLGLLMKGFFESRFTKPEINAKANALRGTYFIRAGQMAVTLTFDRGEVTIEKGNTKPVLASISGEMDALLALITGGSILGAVWPILSGRVRLGGNPISLLPLMPIMM